MRGAEPLNYLLDVEESRGVEALDKERVMQRERGQKRTTRRQDVETDPA